MDLELLLKYDKKIQEINIILKKLKEKRNTIEAQLIDQYKDKEPIKFDNTIISCVKQQTLPPLSIKLLSNIFEKIFDTDNKNKILAVINSYRNNNKKNEIVLKRKPIRIKSLKRRKKSVSKNYSEN